MKNLKFSILLTISALIFFGVACSSSSDENENFTDSVTEETDTDTEPNTETEESSSEEVELSEVAQQGETIFNTNCIACHLMSDEDLIGPGMKGVTDRREKEWIKTFVKNSTEVIESGDEYAVALYEKYNKAVMTPFNFTDEEFEALYAYMEANK